MISMCVPVSTQATREFEVRFQFKASDNGGGLNCEVLGAALIIPRVIIADDHPIILHGCQVVLLSYSNFAKIQATATSVPELFSALENHACDVLIVDYSMPGDGVDGMYMLGSFNRRYPNVPVLVLTAEENLGILQLILKKNVSGLLQKNSDILCLSQAIRVTLRGGVYLNDALKKALVESCSQETCGEPLELLRA